MPKRQTVLILSNSIGGLFMFRKEVVKALLDADYSVTIATPSGDEKKTEWFYGMGCDIEVIPIDRRGTNPLSDVKLLKRYLNLMRAKKPKLVLTYTVKPNIYGGIAASMLRIPYMANITGLGDSIENPGLLQKFTKFLYRSGLKNAKKVFCQNISILNFCERNKIGKERCLLPGSGVNLNWHKLQPYPSENQTLKFNFIGRAMRDKGIEEFFHMTKSIKAKYPEVEFHMYGRCEERYEERLKEMQDAGFVVWHGSVPDIREYFGDSFCTIHPSYHEGMANVILETCAAGRPVITCDINGCKEAVDDGVNGYLCKVRDENDLTVKVEKFINLPYEKKLEMGKAARRKMEKEFDRQLVIDSYMRVINSI